MKVIIFYICDVVLFLLSIATIHLYDSCLYKYLDFWLEGLAIAVGIATASVGVGASIAFTLQKLRKKKIEFHRSFKYTFTSLAILGGLIGVGLFAYACFILKGGWDALGYCILVVISFCVSGTSLVALVVYYIVRKLKRGRSKEDDLKRDIK